MEFFSSRPSGWMVDGSISERGWEFISSSPSSDRLWEPPSFLYNGYRFFPWGYSSWSVRLTTHLHRVPRSRMRGAILPLPQYAFKAWCSVKNHRDTFTLPLPYPPHLEVVSSICNLRTRHVVVTRTRIMWEEEYNMNNKHINIIAYAYANYFAVNTFTRLLMRISSN
jgi:hypothetical protein